jgi:hypothetical protein
MIESSCNVQKELEHGSALEQEEDKQNEGSKNGLN